MSTVLVPRPGDDLVPDGWWQQVVVPWADGQASLDDVATAAARLAGLIAAYRTLGDDTLELTKARRYLEVRWGELLGSVEPGYRSDLEPSHASEGLSKDDRLRFRQLASGRDQVVELLEHATDPDDITRAACIRFAKPAAPSARDIADAIGFEDDDDEPQAADADAWTAADERHRRRVDDLLQDARTLLAEASSDRSYTRATRARLVRDAEIKARQATGQLGELAFSLER